MNLQIKNTEKICQTSEIADYLDGELSPKAEIEIELHLIGCESCREELNFQKQFLGAIDSELENLPELPENFTKTVVVKAESNVAGLRRKDERFRAVFICAGLFLLVVLGLGSETKTVFSAFGSFVNQVAVHFLFDLMVGLTVILKFISHQFSPESFFALVFFAAIVIFGLLFISRSKLIFSRF